MYTKEFDTQLKGINHYKNFPILMPFIGLNYTNSNSIKLLLIAESHYLPEHSSISNNVEKWYNLNETHLTSEELDYINTREITSSKWNQPGHMIFRELENKISNHIQKYLGRSINSC